MTKQNYLRDCVKCGREIGMHSFDGGKTFKCQFCFHILEYYPPQEWLESILIELTKITELLGVLIKLGGK